VQGNKLRNQCRFEGTDVWHTTKVGNGLLDDGTRIFEIRSLVTR